MPWDPQTEIDAIQQAATDAYNKAKLQGDADSLAFQKAQAAIQNAINLSNQYGYSTTSQPAPGTPTFSAQQALGYVGYIPDYSGGGYSQTPGQLAQQASTAQAGAGLTGFYAAPAQSQFTPGTFVRLDPSTYDTNQYGQLQMSYVTPTGQLQRVNEGQARAMGWNGNFSAMIPAAQAIGLERAAPSSIPQQTLASLSQYSNLNTAAQNQAAAQAQQTGMYTAPAQIQAPGTDMSGRKFSDLDQATQMAYYVSNGSDWSAAMNKWVQDANAAITQYAQQNGTPLPNQAGTPTETLAAQNQYFTQAQNLAQLYGQYYAPSAPGQTAQAGVNAPQVGQQTLPYQQFQQQTAQSYLDLLSRLRGPADWAKYQQVLGATPGGIKDLTAAAAGQYLPGGGATTGVQPQAVDLNSFVSQATGQSMGAGSGAVAGQGGAGQPNQAQQAASTLVAPNQMSPQAWNAFSPSQQQMLLGMWESQGYTQDDAKNLFNQSLPKYTGSSPQVGAFRLQ